MNIRRKAIGSAVVAAGLIAATAGTAHAQDRKADVRLVAAPAAVGFPAGGSATVQLTYSNVGNVTKEGSTISAEIPQGVTVVAHPAPGWTCHVDDWPALICTTADSLRPGEVIVPAEVVLGAPAAVDTAIEFGTLGFYRDPTENPADNYSTVTVQAG